MRWTWRLAGNSQTLARCSCCSRKLLVPRPSGCATSLGAGWQHQPLQQQQSRNLQPDTRDQQHRRKRFQVPATAEEVERGLTKEDMAVLQPWRRHIDIDGHLTEVFCIEPDEGVEATEQVLIIPGNPGLAGYYVPYMRSLHASLQGKARVFAISHLGFDLNPRPSFRVWSLAEQIQHKNRFVEDHMMRPGDPPIHFVGHSIGAYMALKMTEDLERNAAISAKSNGKKVPAIKKIVSVFPFFSVDHTSSQQAFIRRLTWFPLLGAIAGALLSWLPLFVRRWLTLTIPSNRMDEHAVTATIGLARFGALRQALHMGKSEFHQLDPPTDFDWLRSFGERLVVIAAPTDHWFPLPAFEELRRRLPHVEAHMEPEQRHDFCTSITLSGAMAQRTARALHGQLPKETFSASVLRDMAAHSERAHLDRVSIDFS